MADRFTTGLAGLDGRQTRQRLADLITECRAASTGDGGQALRDQIGLTERVILRAVQGEILRLAGHLAAHKEGASKPAPIVKPPADAFAVARAEHEATSPAAAAPEPAPPSLPATRPVLPARPARLPPMSPGRFS